MQVHESFSTGKQHFQSFHAAHLGHLNLPLRPVQDVTGENTDEVDADAAPGRQVEVGLEAVRVRGRRGVQRLETGQPAVSG